MPAEASTLFKAFAIADVLAFRPDARSGEGAKLPELLDAGGRIVDGHRAAARWSDRVRGGSVRNQALHGWSVAWVRDVA